MFQIQMIFGLGEGSTSSTAFYSFGSSFSSFGFGSSTTTTTTSTTTTATTSGLTSENPGISTAEPTSTAGTYKPETTSEPIVQDQPKVELHQGQQFTLLRFFKIILNLTD